MLKAPDARTTYTVQNAPHLRSHRSCSDMLDIFHLLARLHHLGAEPLEMTSDPPPRQSPGCAASLHPEIASTNMPKLSEPLLLSYDTRCNMTILDNDISRSRANESKPSLGRRADEHVELGPPLNSRR